MAIRESSGNMLRISLRSKATKISTLICFVVSCTPIIRESCHFQCCCQSSSRSLRLLSMNGKITQRGLVRGLLLGWKCSHANPELKQPIPGWTFWRTCSVRPAFPFWFRGVLGKQRQGCQPEVGDNRLREQRDM